MKKATVWVLAFMFSGTLAFSQTGDWRVDRLCQGDMRLAKMTSDILQMRLAIEQVRKTTPKPKASDILAKMAAFAPQAIRQGQLQCIIGVTKISKDLLDSCRKAGLAIQGTYSYPNLNQVVVRCNDPHQLDAIARRSGVRGITTEPYAIQSVGSVENEAVHSIRVDEVTQTFGVDGSGVRIGVMSDSIADQSLQGGVQDGFAKGTDSQVTGDLPEEIRVVDVGDGKGNDEGAAMCELIHDMAPGAALSFASAKYSYAAFPGNIKKLWTDPGYECDVLVDDISFLQEPIYQHGPIALAALEAVANGVAYFTAASNFANNGHERPFTDVNPGVDDNGSPPSGNDFHDFGVAYGLDSDPYLTLRLASYNSITVALRWDEPYGGVLGAGPGAESDLDLYVVTDKNVPLTDGDNGNILASSTSIQGDVGAPAGEPIEFLSYFNTDDALTVHVVVNHQKGRVPGLIHVFVILGAAQEEGDFIDKQLVMDRTITGHMVAKDLITVAAMSHGEIDSNGAEVDPAGELNVEAFTALGGNVPILFSSDGMTRLDSPLVNFKPDVTGPEATSTSVFGFETFKGTSAAAPNLAAVACLMLDADPSLTPQEIQEALTTTAHDAESPGQDALSGFGVVDAFDAVQAVLGSSVSDWSLYR